VSIREWRCFFNVIRIAEAFSHAMIRLYGTRYCSV